MKKINKATSLKTILVLSFGCISATTNAAYADEIKWDKYMQSAAVVSTIATAISMVDPCSVPLEFTETIENNKVKLFVNCFGNEEDEATAIIEFNQFDGGLLMPGKFDFAG